LGVGPLRGALSDLDQSIQVRDVVPLQDVGREDRAIFASIGAALGALGAMALLLSVTNQEPRTTRGPERDVKDVLRLAGIREWTQGP